MKGREKPKPHINAVNAETGTRTAEKMKFTGKIIISDIDGTYTGSSEGIRRNNEAIEYFKANGGLFTFASGRVEYSIETVVPGFYSFINAPAVLANGSYLFDPKKMQRINEICVDADFALPFLQELHKQLPEAGIRINRKASYLTPEVNDVIYRQLKNYFSNVEKCDFNSMPKDGWNKIVIAGANGLVLHAREYVEKYAAGKFALTMSCSTLLELLNPAATKGNQVRYMKKLLGADYTTYCVGDYENDEDMLRKADVSVCPCSGLKRLVDTADLVACDCREGSLAWLIEYLDKKASE